MAADLSSSKFLLLTLILSVTVLGYYYYDASSVATSLFNDADRLQTMLRSANKTLAELRKELDDCKAQSKVADEELKKVKTDYDAKAKELSDKDAAEKKATADAATLKTEKEALEKSSKELQEKLDKCSKECEESIKKEKEACSSKSGPAATVAPVIPAST